MLQKDLCVFKKARYVCPKALYVFKKLQHLFKKARYVFHVGTDGITPSLSRLFFLFRSSLHFNENIQILNLLRMTGHPLILPSAILAKSLHNLPSAISLCTPTHLFSLPFSVGADPCVCPRTVHFKLLGALGGHMGPPLP